jgi:hypothetical protein
MDSGPLSYSEERLWRGEQPDPDTTAFVECPRHFPLFLRVDGTPDVDVLRASLAHVVERHPVLRSRFVELDGSPMRVLDWRDEIPLAATALGRRSHTARDVALTDVLAAEVNQPFDLAAGPLVRARLIKVTDHRHLFAVVAHHVVFDGWSKQMMANEIARLYAAGGDVAAAGLPPMTTDYGDYVARQREWVRSAQGQEALECSSRRLTSMTTLCVPGDRRVVDGAATRSGVHRFAIPDDCTSRLRDVARARGATPGVAMAALFKVLLHKLTGVEDIAIGMPAADRNRPEFARALGLFLNLIVLRTDVGGNPSFNGLLPRVRRTFVEAFDHASVPYALLRATASDGTPVPPVGIVFNFIIARRPALPRLAIEDPEVDIDTPSCADFSLHVMDRAGALNGTVLYRRERFSPSYVRGMFAYFQSLMSEVLEHPDRPIGDCAAADVDAGAGRDAAQDEVPL